MEDTFVGELVADTPRHGSLIEVNLLEVNMATVRVGGWRTEAVRAGANRGGTIEVKVVEADVSCFPAITLWCDQAMRRALILVVVRRSTNDDSVLKPGHLVANADNLVDLEASKAVVSHLDVPEHNVADVLGDHTVPTI